MGHNWVLVATPDLTAVANAGMGAGLAANYIAAGDKRVSRTPRSSVAVQRDSVTFPTAGAEGGRRLLVPVHFPRPQRADARQVQVRLTDARRVDQRIADLLTLLELEQLEVNLFRGESRDIGSPQVFGGQVLGQALDRRFGDGRGPRRAFAARLLPAPRRLQRADRLPGRPQPGRPQLSPTAGSSRSNTASRSSTWRPPSRSRRTGFDHQIQMPKVPHPEELPDSSRAAA